MKKVSKLIALVLALAMCVALASCGSESSTATSGADASASSSTTTDSTAAASGDTIKIGGIFNITGDQASLDAPEQQGFALAVKEINEAGGINGRQIEAVYYDGQTDQTVCANNAKKLIDSDGVVAIAGLSDSDYAYAAGAVAQEAGVPIVFSGATTPDIPSTVGDCAFLTAFGDDVDGYAAAGYAYDVLGARTAYVLTDKSMSFTTHLSDAFTERFEELGGEVVLTDNFSSGDYDFSAQIARYQSNGEADIMYMATGPDDASTVIEQFRSAGCTAPMISGDGWDTDLWGVAGDLANQDVYCCTHYSADDTSEVVQNFISAYTEEYGTAPENAFAALGYDSAKVIFKAIEMCGDDVTAANIRSNLEQITDLQCVTGTISYTADNHVPDKTVVVTKAVDGVLTFQANY
jgi:branched-chain amino acid transport system substrate-binding protein